MRKLAMNDVIFSRNNSASFVVIGVGGFLGMGEDSRVAVCRGGGGKARRERVAEQRDVVLDVIVSRVAGRSHGVQRVRIRGYATLT